MYHGAMSNLSDFLAHKSPFYFIAEGADAHYGSLDRAKQMVDLAKEVGASAMKFQHHLPDEEMLPDVPLSGNMKEPLYEFLKKNALNIDQHVELADYCKEVEIDYLCTPFSWKAAQELEEFIGPIAYKIGSGELLDHPTIKRIMGFGKPMILSTGMSTPEEIKSSYDLFQNSGVPLILMNCTSAYPPLFEQIHLRFIEQMKEMFPNALIGHSDHTAGIETTIAAFVLGARVFEKHVTVDHQLAGPDSNVSINFETLKQLIEMLNNLDKSLGAVKQIHDSEWEIRAWAHRSLVYLKDFKAGDVIAANDIWGKRPGTGIPSYNYDLYVGKILKQDVMANTLLSNSDFE